MVATLQSTNRVGHAKVRETTFGVTPANPAFKAMRVTSSGLSASPQTVVSGEIRADRQVADLILVGQQAQGQIGSELSFQTADDDLEEALQGTWVSQPAIVVATSDTEISDVTTNVVTVAAGGAAFKAGMTVLVQGMPTAANNKTAVVTSSTATSVTFPAATFTAETVPIPVGASIRVVGFQGASGDLVAVAAPAGLTSTTLDFTTLGIVPGTWLNFGSNTVAKGFATAANNDWVRVSAVTAHLLSFDRTPTGWVADAGTGKTLQVWMGDYLRNAAVMRSNTIERQYLDQSPVGYEYLTGMCLDRYSLSFPSQRIVTATANYVGRSGQIASARVTGATDVAAPGTDVLNTSSNVGRLGFNGVTVTGPNFVMEATLDIANNLRMQDAVGAIGAIGVGNGEFTLSGTLNTYFGDPSIYQAALNNSAASIDLRVGRTDGNQPTLIFDVPRLKLSAGAPSVTGKNQDVMLSASFQGIRDPVLGYTLQVQRYWYTE